MTHIPESLAILYQLIEVNRRLLQIHIDERRKLLRKIYNRNDFVKEANNNNVRHKEYMKKYNQRRRKEIAAKTAEWRKKNAQHIREYNQKYRQSSHGKSMIRKYRAKRNRR